ncbi:MAG: hypothetical protein ABJH05_02680 [Fulvivirga sp.]
MKDQKFDSIYSNEGSDTIAKELTGILIGSFLVALTVVIAIFMIV